MKLLREGLSAVLIEPSGLRKLKKVKLIKIKTFLTFFIFSIYIIFIWCIIVSEIGKNPKRKHIMLRKITIQLEYGETEYHWTISDRKKRLGGKLNDNEYHNYLIETIATNVGYNVVHGSGEHIGSVEDVNNHIRYATYTLMVR